MTIFSDIVAADMKEQAATLERYLRLREANLLSPLYGGPSLNQIVGSPDEDILQAKRSLQCLKRLIELNEAK